MKAVHVAKEYPPYVYGGVGIHLKYLTRALAKLPDVDIEVRAFHGVDQHYRPPTIKMEGTPYVTYYCPPCRFISYQYSQVLDSMLLDLDWASEPTDADIFHTHTWYANFVNVMAKRLHDVKTISTVHSLEPLRPWKAEQLTAGGHALSSWMESTGLQDADKVIAVSAGMADDIVKHIGVERSKISVVHNGVDLNVYRPKGSDSSPFPPDPELERAFPYALFVGRLTRQKGIEDLIEAWKNADTNGRKLILLTGKEDTSELIEETRKQLEGVDDIFWLHKQLSERDVITLYQNADLFVCPSRYEPFGIINLEAMACGVPVVACGVGGIKEVVTDETGIMVPPRDPTHLSDAIEKMLSDDDLRAKKAANCRPYVEANFSWDAIALKTREVYKEAIDGN